VGGVSVRPFEQEGANVKTKYLRGMVAAAAAAVAMVASTGHAQSSGEQLQITAFAVNMSNIGTGANAVVEITVKAWSTPEEREKLITTMVEQGPKKLLEVLQDMPDKGRFYIPSLRGSDPHNLRLGLTLRYAWQQPLPDGGRRIVLAADRYIGMAEARNQPRTIDYPFTLFEIRANKEGKGEGKLAYATKIKFDKDKKVMEIENYSSEPVRLQNLQIKTKAS
jgi:hypothetical protein